MKSCSAIWRLLAGRPDGGAQDAGDFPGLLQQSRVLLNSTVLQIFQPVHALVSLFKCDVQFRSKCRARAALASGAIIGAHRRRRAQKLTAGVVSLRACRQAAIEGEHGQREAAGSFDKIPGRHGTGWRAIRVPRGYSGKSRLHFPNFALSTSLPTPYFALSTFSGGRHG